MTKVKIFLLFMFAIIVYSAEGLQNIPENILRNIIHSKSTKFLILRICVSLQEKVDMIKLLTAKGIRVHGNHKLDNDTTASDKYKCGIILDSDYIPSFDLHNKDLDNSKYIFGAEHIRMFLKRFRTSLKRMDGGVTIISLDTINYFELWNVSTFYNGNASNGLIGFKNYRTAINTPNKINMSNATIRILNPERCEKESEIIDCMTNIRYKYIDPDQKLNFAILRILGDMLHFKIGFIKLDRNCSDELEKRTIRSHIVDNTIDLGIDFVYLEAVKEVDYIMPIYPYKRSFVFRNFPGGGRNIFLQPFSSEVWSCLFVLALISAIAYCVLLMVENEILEHVESNGLGTTTLITLAIYCQQGAWFLPNLLSGRILIFNLLILSLLSFNYYISTVVSSLLNNPEPFITTLGSLQRSDLSLGSNNDAYPNQQFELDMLNERSRQMYFNYTEGAKKIRTESFAYCADAAIVYAYLLKSMRLSEICNIFEVDVADMIYKSVVVPKNWQFKETFKISYRRLQEFGLYKRELTRWLERKPPCLVHVDFEELSLVHVYSAFIVFAAGVVMSILLLCIELFWAKMKHKNRSWCPFIF